MSFFSGKKIFLLGFIIVLLFAIPLTVYLTQQQQDVTSQAAPTTILSFVPTSKTMNVGDSASFDVMMDPGSNQVSFIKLTLTYDATKFTVDQASGLVPNSDTFGAPLQGPTYTSGAVSVSLSVGSDPARVITSTTKIATLTLKAIAETGGSTTLIQAPKVQQQVLSVASGDQANEDVLAGQPAPATVTIGPGSAPTANKAPVCTSLVLDRAATGPAPYSVTFTASGKDEDGTVSKVSFTFGDGKIGDATSGGGIGTNSVNAQISHTYQNAGTYTASAVLTDSNSGTSSETACTTTITVTGGTSGGGTGGGTTTGGGVGAGGTGTGGAAVPTAEPTEVIPTKILTPIPTIDPTGPGETIIGVGAIGIMLSILGGIILLGL